MEILSQFNLLTKKMDISNVILNFDQEIDLMHTKKYIVNEIYISNLHESPYKNFYMVFTHSRELHVKISRKKNRSFGHRCNKHYLKSNCNHNLIH